MGTEGICEPGIATLAYMALGAAAIGLVSVFGGKFSKEKSEDSEIPIEV